MMFHVYELADPTDGSVFYVGKGNARRKRLNDHIRQGERLIEGKSVKNRILAGTIRGILEKGLAPLFNVIFESEDENLILAIEVELIAKYGRINTGTGCLSNLTNGAEGACGLRHTEESKLAIGRASKSRKMSDAAREKIRVAATGRSHTFESKQKIGERSKSRIVSEETKLKISIAGKGRVLSEVTRSRISESKKGSKNPRFGNSEKLSQSHRDAIKISWIARRTK
jgi:hypothetical protein